MPNPANCRIVQVRPRYIDGYTPRVNGYWPGSPIGSSSEPIPAGRSRSVYSGAISSPDRVVNDVSRSGVSSYARCHCS